MPVNNETEKQRLLDMISSQQSKLINQTINPAVQSGSVPEKLQDAVEKSSRKPKGRKSQI